MKYETANTFGGGKVIKVGGKAIGNVRPHRDGFKSMLTHNGHLVHHIAATFEEAADALCGIYDKMKDVPGAPVRNRSIRSVGSSRFAGPRK